MRTKLLYGFIASISMIAINSAYCENSTITPVGIEQSQETIKSDIKNLIEKFKQISKKEYQAYTKQLEERGKDAQYQKAETRLVDALNEYNKSAEEIKSLDRTIKETKGKKEKASYKKDRKTLKKKVSELKKELKKLEKIKKDYIKRLNKRTTAANGDFETKYSTAYDEVRNILSKLRTSYDFLQNMGSNKNVSEKLGNPQKISKYLMNLSKVLDGKSGGIFRKKKKGTIDSKKLVTVYNKLVNEVGFGLQIKDIVTNTEQEPNENSLTETEQKTPELNKPLSMPEGLPPPPNFTKQPKPLNKPISETEIKVPEQNRPSSIPEGLPPPPNFTKKPQSLNKPVVEKKEEKSNVAPGSAPSFLDDIKSFNKNKLKNSQEESEALKGSDTAKIVDALLKAKKRNEIGEALEKYNALPKAELKKLDAATNIQIQLQKRKYDQMRDDEEDDDINDNDDDAWDD